MYPFCIPPIDEKYPFHTSACRLKLCKCTVLKISMIYKTRTFLGFFTGIECICLPFFAFLQTKITDFPSLQKSLPRTEGLKSPPLTRTVFRFRPFRVRVTGVLTVVSIMYMSRIFLLVRCNFFNERLFDSPKSVVFSWCVFKPSIFTQQNKIKALAAHPLLCDRFSMTSASSKADLKLQTNYFALETNHAASIVF